MIHFYFVMLHFSKPKFVTLAILQTTKKEPAQNRFLQRAADGNRTRDLRTTNATLYRLSHSSIFAPFTLPHPIYL